MKTHLQCLNTLQFESKEQNQKINKNEKWEDYIIYETFPLPCCCRFCLHILRNTQNIRTDITECLQNYKHNRSQHLSKIVSTLANESFENMYLFLDSTNLRKHTKHYALDCNNQSSLSTIHYMLKKGEALLCWTSNSCVLWVLQGPQVLHLSSLSHISHVPAVDSRKP